MKKIRFVGVVEKTEDGRKKLFRKYYFRVLLPNGRSVSSTRLLQVGEDENTILLGANNKLYYPQPDLSDVQNPKYPSIGAFRAYFRLYNNDFKVKEFQINFSDNDSEDGIKNVNVKMMSTLGCVTIDK